MKIRSAEYVDRGKLVRVRLDPNSLDLVVMVYSDQDATKMIGDHHLPFRAMERRANTEITELAVWLLGLTRGTVQGESFVLYGGNLGPMPNCTYSDVGDMVRELERFSP